MIQFLVAAPCSGSGKTTLTCALLAALKRRGQDPCSFKSGPDYIDPMFHRAVLGVESHNLDLFFSAPETVRALYAQAAAGHGAAVCEGAMGFYDGLGGVSDIASAWHLADTLGLPVLLVVQPRGASLTLAAQINGLKQFRTPSHLAGILLNDCAPHLYALLAPMLERETGLPVLGYLPHLPDAALESRHLGLKTAGEIADLQQKISRMADALVVDWEKLFALTEGAAPLVHTDRLPPAGRAAAPGSSGTAPPCSHCRCKGCGVLLHLRRNAGSTGAGGGGALLVQPPAGLRPAGADRRALSARRLPGAVCRAVEREPLHAGLCAPGCGARSAHGGRVRGLSLSGPEPGGCQRKMLAHGRCPAGAGLPGGAAGAVWIRGTDRPRRQYAVPRRGASARARVPPLGFHGQRHRIYRRKAQRETMGLRLCK